MITMGLMDPRMDLLFGFLFNLLHCFPLPFSNVHLLYVFFHRTSPSFSRSSSPLLLSYSAFDYYICWYFQPLLFAYYSCFLDTITVFAPKDISRYLSFFHTCTKVLNGWTFLGNILGVLVSSASWMWFS